MWLANPCFESPKHLFFPLCLYPVRDNQTFSHVRSCARFPHTDPHRLRKLAPYHPPRLNRWRRLTQIWSSPFPHHGVCSSSSASPFSTPPGSVPLYFRILPQLFTRCDPVLSSPALKFPRTHSFLLISPVQPPPSALLVKSLSSSNLSRSFLLLLISLKPQISLFPS